MSATYRDENEGLKLQIEALLERYREESKSLAKPLRRLYVRRSARMLAGTVAIVGTALLTLVTVFIIIRARSFDLLGYSSKRNVDVSNGWLTPMLLAILAMVMIAYMAGLLLARGEITAKLARAIPRTGEAHRDLAKLEAASPLLELRRLLVEQEQRSISLPLVGALLLLPLALPVTVCMLLYVLFTDVTVPLVAFDALIVWSVVLSTPAHLVIAPRASRFPRHLAAWCEAYKAVELRPPLGAGRTVGIVAAVSFIPGVIVAMSLKLGFYWPLIAVFPAIFAALASAVFVIPAFYVARQRFLAERKILAA